MVRFRSTALVFVLLSIFNAAHAVTAKLQTSSCVSFYQGPVDSFLKKIQSLSDKRKSDSNWLAFPKSEPETQALVEQLIQLSSFQRENVLKQVVKHKPKHREFRRVVLLALYDKATWFEFIDRATKGPLLDDSMVNSLIPIIRSMPENMKAEVLAKVTPNYSKLSKVNFTKFPLRTNLRLAPKRSIDALILHIIKPDEWFKRDYEITNNALETYTRYLQFLKSDIFKNSDRGNYSTPEILTVAEAMQKVLQANIDKFKGPSSITVTGSFPNGRAKISDTDLDSRISHQEMHALLDDMSASVNQAMKVYPFPSKFTVEAMWATTTAHFAAQINPLFLRITPNEIQIEVYPAVRPLHKDSVLMDYNYQAPTRYTLKSNDFQRQVISITPRKEIHDSKWLESQLIQGLDDFSFTVKPSKKPKTSATAAEIVDAALNVSDARQRDLLFMLRQKPEHMSASKDAQKLIKLALFNKNDWELLIRDAIKQPQENDSLFNALVPVFKKMQPELKSFLQKVIAEAYPDVSNRAWLRTGFFLKKVYGVISPRDALDVVTNQIFPPKDFIEQQANEGSTAESAYNLFLKRQHEMFYQGAKAIKFYDLAQVKSVAQKIQSAIKKNPDLFGANGVQIVGRFPNGRAELNDLSIEVLVMDPLNKKLASELSYALNGKTKPRAKEFIDIDIKTIATTVTKEAIINPIQIKVLKDSIELHVYAPIQNMDRDKFQLPQNYPAPATYVLPIQTQIVELKEAS